MFISIKNYKKSYSIFYKSISKALASLEDASLTMETTQIEGLYGNRNVKDGCVDKSINVLRFMNSHSKMKYVLSFKCLAILPF